MPAWLLKMLAVALTSLSALGSSAYVAKHIKDAQAPLHPPVVASTTGGAIGFPGSGPAGRAQPGRRAAVTGGHLNLSPSVRTSDSQQPLTFTSVS